MSLWEREYGATTRGQIVTLLRGANRSVDELAAELGLTDNAVRAHLSVLLREQIVQAVGVRREGSVGKPASIYGIAPGALPLFSRAYSPLLAALLAELRAHSTPSAIRGCWRARAVAWPRTVARPAPSRRASARVRICSTSLADPRMS
jgi:Predicted transcriptional regulator